MNILFLLPRYHTNIIETIKVHIKLGHNVEMHVKTFGAVEDYSIIKPIKFQESFLTKYLKNIFKINTINNSFYLPSLIKYYFYLKRSNHNYAIIRVHGILYTYVISLILSLCKIKIIYYQQTNINLKFLEKNNYLLNLRKFEFFFRLKVFNAKWVSPLKNENYNIKTKNIFYLPFVVKIKKNKLNISNLNILTVGKFVKRKNQLLLLESISSFIKIYNIKITIVGEVSNGVHEKYLKKIEDFVEINNLKKYVFIKKNVHHNKMNYYYSQNNLFVLPATQEPASIALLEAMGSGLPCICSDTCGTKTYIRDGFNGFTFEDNNKNDLKDKISFFIKNLTILKKMSDNTFQYSENNISFENYKYKFEKVIN